MAANFEAAFSIYNSVESPHQTGGERDQLNKARVRSEQLGAARMAAEQRIERLGIERADQPEWPSSASWDDETGLKRLQEYVMNGDIVEVITGAELAAAREAFEKAKTAEAKRSQVWSAINHLEAAHHRLRATYHGKTSWTGGAVMYRNRMSYHSSYVCGVRY